MSVPCKLDRKEIIVLAKKYKGKVALVARELDCAVSTIYNYAKKYKSVARAIKSAQVSWDCTLVDAAETKLYQAVTTGAAWAVRYTLETKGRKRGYATTLPATSEGDSKMTPVKVNVVVEKGTPGEK